MQSVWALIIAGVLLISLTSLSQSQTQDPPPPRYYLPWAGDVKLYTLQGQNQGSHVGFYSKYAYDFGSGPLDGSSFVVRAARAGRVFAVVDAHSSSKDCDPKSAGASNYIVIDHLDGEASYYSHLAQSRIIPKVGDWVERGDALAQSDHTGFVCGIGHLHFTLMDIKTGESLDRPFVDTALAKDRGRPQSGRWYLSDNYPIQEHQTQKTIESKAYIPRITKGGTPPTAVPSPSPTPKATPVPIFQPDY